LNDGASGPSRFLRCCRRHFLFVPFLIAAGALQYSREKFLGALTLGRLVRYSIVAGLGALYGTHIVRFFSRYDKPV